MLLLRFFVCIISIKENLIEWISLSTEDDARNRELIVNRLVAYQIYVKSILFSDLWVQLIKKGKVENQNSYFSILTNDVFRGKIESFAEILFLIILKLKNFQLPKKLESRSAGIDKISEHLDNDLLSENLVCFSKIFFQKSNFTGDIISESNNFASIFNELAINLYSRSAEKYCKKYFINDIKSTSDEESDYTSTSED